MVRFEIIKTKVAELQVNSIETKINSPETDEQRYYRDIFDKEYPQCADIVPYFWMPKYVNADDASARTLDVYKKNLEVDSSNDNSSSQIL